MAQDTKCSNCLDVDGYVHPVIGDDTQARLCYCKHLQGNAARKSDEAQADLFQWRKDEEQTSRQALRDRRDGVETDEQMATVSAKARRKLRQAGWWGS